jgi:hypothetical protein
MPAIFYPVFFIPGIVRIERSVQRHRFDDAAPADGRMRA